MSISIFLISSSPLVYRLSSIRLEKFCLNKIAHLDIFHRLFHSSAYFLWEYKLIDFQKNRRYSTKLKAKNQKRTPQHTPNKKILDNKLVIKDFMRSVADLNRCTRFCRPLPNRSANRPFLNERKDNILFHIKKQTSKKLVLSRL